MMDEIVLYSELKKLGGSYYLNVKKSDVDFHDLKEGQKLVLKVNKLLVTTKDDN